VVLTIAGIEDPTFDGFPLYEAKRVAKQIVLDGPVPATVVKSTQWYEFATNPAAVTGNDGEVIVEDWLIQPIAADTVADVLVEAALGQIHSPHHHRPGCHAATRFDVEIACPARRWPSRPRCATSAAWTRRGRAAGYRWRQSHRPRHRNLAAYSGTNGRGGQPGSGREQATRGRRVNASGPRRTDRNRRLNGKRNLAADRHPVATR
jgi:hypothetical protein